MEIEKYKRLLLAKEKQLLNDLNVEGTNAREQKLDLAHDVGDESVDDDIKSGAVYGSRCSMEVAEAGARRIETN